MSKIWRLSEVAEAHWEHGFLALAPAMRSPQWRKISEVSFIINCILVVYVLSFWVHMLMGTEDVPVCVLPVLLSLIAIVALPLEIKYGPLLLTLVRRGHEMGVSTILHASHDEMLMWLMPSSLQVHPNRLCYSQAQIKRKFSNGCPVDSNRPYMLPFATHTVAACFHKGTLFALNNEVLYNALENQLEEVTVYIVDKPLDSWARFRGNGDEVTLHGLRVVIPPDAFPTQEPRPAGHVVLEANNLIKPGPGQDTLASLIQARFPNIRIEACDGDRGYARVRVALEVEEVVKAIIKGIARELRKKTNVREVPGTRCFYSPRD